MGLLDQILGGVVGGALGQRSPSGGGLGDVFGGGLRGGMGSGMGGGLGGAIGGALGGGKGRLLMVLLPVVLQLLANRQRGGGAAGLAGGEPFGGGMGGMGGMGGLGGLLEQFTRMGYGQQAQSWVSTGDNEPLPPSALDGVLGQDRLSAIAAQAGVSEDEAREGIAQLLPEVVDRVTPGGQLPGQDELLASIDDLERRLGGG